MRCRPCVGGRVFPGAPGRGGSGTG